MHSTRAGRQFYFEEPRTTDSLRPGRMGEFLARSSRACAACALVGGDKTCNDRWYDENIPLADNRYDDYLREVEEEGL